MIGVSWLDGCTTGSSSSFFIVGTSFSFPSFFGWFFCMDLSSMIGGGRGAANSLSLLRVMALHYSLPSLIEFTYEVLGNVPCYLLVNKVAI